MFTVALNLYAQCIPFRLCHKAGKLKGDDISVLAFNIHGVEDTYSQHEEDILALVLEPSADIVLLTEYSSNSCSDTLHNRILRSGYECVMRNHATGDAIYSKLGGKWEKLGLTPSSTGTITLIETSALDKDISLYFCHLSSNNYDASKKNFSPPDEIKDYYGLKFYLGRVKAATVVRAQEADILLKRVGQGETPTIVLGDMNDVSGSPAMNTLRKAGFKDAWWMGGFGYGATYHNPVPFRIDHILFNDGLKLKQIKKISSNGWSDHDALYAVFEIKK